jgi:Ca2+-binding EF-hand superfamily protein
MVSLQSILTKCKSLATRRREAKEKEIRKLMKSIKKTMKMQKREVEGIGDIKFTVGVKEMDAFQAENDSWRARGDPYFVRAKNDIGSKNEMIVIWYKLVSNKDEFMTDIVLGSTQPKHKNFFFGEKEAYKPITHPQMKGFGPSDPNLCIWFKKEVNQIRHASDIQVSHSKEDEVNLQRRNYVMLPLCLSKFGCGYAKVWILWTSTHVLRLTDCDHIQKELNEYTEFLAKTPDDPILRKMVDTARFRLKEAQLREEDHARDIPGDDLVYTKEFLALKPTELKKMRSVYKRCIDLDNDGKISVEDFASFLREPLSLCLFLRQIFALALGNIDTQSDSNKSPMFNLGSTLKAVAVFCMLSSADLIKFIFSCYDIKGYGFIDRAAFYDLLELFHPRHRDDRVHSALKEIEIPTDGTLLFAAFEDISKRFPHLLYPAFRVQETLRQKFLGVRWWKRKLDMYSIAAERVDRDKKRENEIESMERKERYEMAEELQHFDVKKKRRRATPLPL